MIKPRSSSAFTLLELVVVLAILAVVTTIATRTLDRALDQNRFEASQRSLQEIERAVMGDPDERASDGTRVFTGFVADMGRLPRTVVDPEDGKLSLRELWDGSGLAPYSVREAVGNGVPAQDEDHDVLVAGGWRGPYLRLPIGAKQALDGWGNPYESPADPSPTHPESTGYARLRAAGNVGISAAGQEIAIVRHLGADATEDLSPDQDASNDDQAISFENRVAAALKASVQVVDKDGPAPGSGTDRIVVRVFSPDPDNALKIRVAVAAETMLASTPVTVPAAADATIGGLTVGRRPVRAYLTAADGSLIAKSAVKYVALQPGTNFVEFTIRRP